MPAALSHWILGKRLLMSQDFSDEFPRINKNAFLWGCQGPDIFFFHRKLPWQKNDSLKKYGSYLHVDDPALLFRSLAKICRYCADAENANAIFSYALGYCCHYCYDRNLHPLVYYNTALLEKTDIRGFDYNYHADIEANMDIILLRREYRLIYKGNGLEEISMNNCLPQFAGVEKTISQIYKLLLMDLYGEKPNDLPTATLAGDFMLTMGLLDDKYFVKKPIMEFAEKILPNMAEGVVSGLMHSNKEDMSFDHANLLRNTWFNPSDRSQRSKADLYEITAQAEKDTLTLTKMFAAAVADKNNEDFDSFICGINFNGRLAEQDSVQF